MRKTASFALVLWLVFGAEIARGWGEDMQNDFKQFSEEHKLVEKAESVKQGASEAYDQAKDKADSWSDWAYDKMGFGKNEEVKETTHYVVDKTAEGAKNMKSKSESVGEAPAEKAGDMRVKAKEAFEDGKEKAAEAAVHLKSKSENVEDGKEKAAANVKSKAENVVGAKAEKGGDMKEKAAEEIVGAAKGKGESAKEMASKAVGDIGATMREKKAEL